MTKIDLKTIALCSLFMFIGPSLVLLNKYILSNLHFPYPMFLSGLGVLFSASTAHILVYIGAVKINKREELNQGGSTWYKSILPIGFCHASSMGLGNIAYLFLNVGFIQMLKSFVPVIIVITLYLAKVESPTRFEMLAITIISLGTAGTCTYTLELNLIGLLLMLGAEICESIRVVFTQYYLQNLKLSVFEGQYYLAPASACFLMGAAFIFEVPKMLVNNAFYIMYSNPFYFMAGASLGLCVNFLTYYVIQLTSSLTMKVLGSVRNILVIVCGVVFYAETVTLKEGLGYSVAFLGFLLYSAIKSGYFKNYSSPLNSSLGGGSVLLAADKSSHKQDEEEEGQLLPHITTMNDLSVHASSSSSSSRK